MVKHNQVSVYQEEHEQRQVKKDLVWVLLLNAIFTAGLIGLYFWNASSGQVDRLISGLLNF